MADENRLDVLIRTEAELAELRESIHELKEFDKVAGLFVAAGDWRLKAGSAGIGAGTNLSSYFTTDIAGTLRGTTWDIGAYEFEEGEEVEPDLEDPPAAVPGNATAVRVNVGRLIRR